MLGERLLLEGGEWKKLARFSACPNGADAKPPGGALSTPAYQKLVSGKDGYLSMSATKGSEVSMAEKGAMTLPA